MTGNDEKIDQLCTRCQAPAKLQCPKCLDLKLPKTGSVFCTQECFKAAWADHKKMHKPGPDSWGYCAKKGRGRTHQPPTFNWTGDLRPHMIGPTRKVPDHIPRPDYAEEGIPISEEANRGSISIRTAKEIDGIRKACRLGREALDAAHRAIRPGITTDEIDRIVHEAIIEGGGYPSPLNYYFFPKSVCTSVNEVICHGIPDARELQDGDIVNVDVTAYLGGWHGDLNETFVVGNVDRPGKALVKTAHDCMMAAIAIVKPGVRFREVGDVISKVAQQSKMAVVRTYCGHGIGDLFHCNPNVPHYAANKAVGLMKEGQVFTIEPMINLGGWKDVLWPDDWTAATVDGQRSAQFEHQLVVTATGCEVLTARLPTSPPLWWETEEQPSDATGAAAAAAPIGA